MRNSKSKLKAKYQYIGFLPNSVRIKENGYWGINDFDGNEILPSNFIEVFTLSSGYGLIAARDAGYWKIYDFDGNQINSKRFDIIYPYYGMFGMTKVKIKNKWGLVNKFGKLIIPVEYKKIERFGKGLALTQHNSEIEFIEKKDLINLTSIRSSFTLDKVKKPVPKASASVNIKQKRAI